MDNVYVYVDGYNFYCGINHPGWLKYGWCDFTKLAARLAERAFGAGCRVEAVKYYTARVGENQENRHGERDRQKMWLDAVRAATPGVNVIEGRFQKFECSPRHEKETDVNIAVDMQVDSEKFAKAILISGDSDFKRAVRAVKARREVVVFLPPNQNQYRLDGGEPYRIEQITKEDLAACRLPEMIFRSGKPPIAWSDYMHLRRDAGLSSN